MRAGRDRHGAATAAATVTAAYNKRPVMALGTIEEESATAVDAGGEGARTEAAVEEGEIGGSGVVRR